jgi:SAM-dependent methyltransferase
MQIGNAVRTPIDVPTRETTSFLVSRLPDGVDVLEVGCGRGHVAEALSSRGHRVTGIDTDGASIEHARTLGVHAMVASWPEYEGPAVDAICFTRSLHHVAPLRDAIGRATALLRPGGQLLVEDFAFEEMNAATMHWFLQVLRSSRGTTLIQPIDGEFVTDLLRSSDPASMWRASHDHALHSMAEMTGAAATCFTLRAAQSVPYLFRYLVPVLAETVEAAQFVDDVFRDEANLGGQGDIVLIGRRIVGVTPPDP